MSPVEVLVAHQRMDAGSCLCGWSVWGASHPEHQAEMITKAGWRIVRFSETFASYPVPMYDADGEAILSEEWTP